MTRSVTRYCDWIAVDWGTSRLRAWAMEGDRAKAEATSNKGAGVLSSGAFEPALLDLVEPWLGAGTTAVIACGMVGAREGWVEAPYRAVPCAPLGEAGIAAPASDRRLTVTVCPGLMQTVPADVMRGEETQIAGWLKARPRFDGIVCLPGTHTKWAQISAGEVVSFRTFMTGELFTLLAGASVLRHSIASDGWDDTAFAEGVNDSLARPEALATALFAIRATALLHDLPPATARARLSGLLIGAELAAARPFWLGQPVVVIGSGGMGRAYREALALQGLTAETAEANEMTVAGLAAAFGKFGAPSA